MILIVGLGNPGKKYQKTRHNLGFRTIDEFQKILGFSDWKLSKKFKAEVSDKKINDEKIILAKPQTFMNESGKAVKSITDFLKLERGPSSFQLERGRASLHLLTADNLWIIHDDIDLPLGKIKITKNRGAGGHKGVQSIINELGTKDFIRFRIGTQPKNKKPKNTEKFVLQNFDKTEEKILKGIIKKTCEAVEIATKQGTEKATTEFNQ